MLLDEEEEERRRLSRQEVFRNFKARREEVEKRREQDRLERNMAKEKQLQEAEEMQVRTLDCTQAVAQWGPNSSCITTTNS